MSTSTGGGEREQVDAVLASLTDLIQSPLPTADDGVLAELGITPSSRLSARERVDIYRQQFWLRHADSLAEDFPATKALLGAAWPDFVRRYLGAHPPSTRSLRELGFRLPDFLAALVRAEVPALARDMCRLECAYLEVFDAPDEEQLDPSDILGLAPEQWLSARLQLSGAVRLLELEQPVAELRRALRQGEASEAQSERAAAPRAVYLVVYRRELGVWDREIAPEAFRLLRRLLLGTPLAQACAESAAESPESEPLLDAHLGEWFATWTRLGWISRVDIP